MCLSHITGTGPGCSTGLRAPDALGAYKDVLISLKLGMRDVELEVQRKCLSFLLHWKEIKILVCLKLRNLNVKRCIILEITFKQGVMVGARLQSSLPKRQRQEDCVFQVSPGKVSKTPSQNKNEKELRAWLKW